MCMSSPQEQSIRRNLPKRFPEAGLLGNQGDHWTCTRFCPRMSSKQLSNLQSKADAYQRTLGDLPIVYCRLPGTESISSGLDRVQLGCLG